MKKTYLLVIAFLAVFGVATFAMGYYGEAPKVVVEGNYIEAGGDNLGGWYSPDITGLLEKTETIAKDDVYASTTLRTVDSGTTYFLSASGTAIYLPAVASAKGVIYRFVVDGAATDGNYTINSDEGDNIEGSVIVAGAVVDCNAADVLTFVVDGENIGDYVELISDGTYWMPLSSGALTASKLTCSG